MAMSFLKRVQGTPKIKAIRKKINSKKAELKTFSRQYRTLIKSESKRVAKTIKGKKKTAKKRRR